jgi:hypothetical protein
MTRREPSIDRAVRSDRNERVGDRADLQPFDPPMSQIKRRARSADIDLTQEGPTWTARDRQTGEMASDYTMVGAWAMLEGVEPELVYHRLRQAGVAPLQTPARTRADITPETVAE